MFQQNFSRTHHTDRKVEQQEIIHLKCQLSSVWKSPVMQPIGRRLLAADAKIRSAQSFQTDRFHQFYVPRNG